MISNVHDRFVLILGLISYAVSPLMGKKGWATMSEQRVSTLVRVSRAFDHNLARSGTKISRLGLHFSPYATGESA